MILHLTGNMKLLYSACSMENELGEEVGYTRRGRPLITVQCNQVNIYQLYSQRKITIVNTRT